MVGSLVGWMVSAKEKERIKDLVLASFHQPPRLCRKTSQQSILSIF
jgi:hypothetical protein